MMTAVSQLLRLFMDMVCEQSPFEYAVTNAACDALLNRLFFSVQGITMLVSPES